MILTGPALPLNLYNLYCFRFFPSRAFTGLPPMLSPNESKEALSMSWFLLLISLALVVYLGAVMLAPEKF